MIFGWGWFLDDLSPVLRCDLEVPLRNGTWYRIRCVPGGMREDLQEAFPQIGHASSAGFIIRGHLPGPVDDAAIARLVCTLYNGHTHVREIAGFPSRFMANWELRGSARWNAFRERAASEGRGAAIAHECKQFRRRLRQWISRLGMTLSLARHNETILVFDHAMGGGANRYREDMVAAMLAEGHGVAVVAFRLETLDYSLSLRRGNRRRDIAHTQLPALLKHFVLASVPEIHINNLVSFPDPVSVIRWARARKGKRGGRVVLHLHDYYPVCPSWTLIDAWGKYCNIPPLEVCRNCLPANTAHTLSLAPDMEMSQWRQEWLGLLDGADTIVAFSEASVDILRGAYPQIDPLRIKVQPHFVDAASLRPVQPVFGNTLVIGVIGHISAAKGALVLQQMARVIREEARPVRIVVIGTLEHHHAGDGIQVTGAYQGSRLPELLEEHLVGVCMLPSICAETFSYVTAEIMAMGMPLAVFGLGAPAERARRYNHGLVISRVDAITALDEIQSFAARLKDATLLQAEKESTING